MKDEAKKFEGLSSAEAKKRLIQDGYNEITLKKRYKIWLTFWEIISEPMLLLLLSAVAVYFLLGEKSDALILSTFVIFFIATTFYQRRKTERALDALRELSSPQALVVRNGEQQKIPSREVVVGDILVLREGDRVAGDALLLENFNLTLDESLLTGESLGVDKIIWNGQSKISDYRLGGSKLPAVYSGTMITSGRGLARVVAIGIQTEIGKIGKSLSEITEDRTLLKKEISRLVKIFGITGLFLCLLVVVIYGLVKNNWLEGVLYGLTVGMSVLPEEFPMVVLIFLTLGSWILTQKKVLTRDSAIIETLGAAKILCVDKTGTLTQNKMHLQILLTEKGELDLSIGDKIIFKPEEQNLLQKAWLASQEEPFDLLEKEIQRSGVKFLAQENIITKDWKVIKEYPFSKNLMALGHAWEIPRANRYIVAVKGAPEAIALLCHFSQKQQLDFEASLKPLMEKGLRMLGVAHLEIEKGELAENLSDYEFKLAGVLGFSDPIRASVPKAVAECHQAGIRICMITGDYPGTAQTIAKKIGLNNAENFLTGDDLRNLSPKELKSKIATTNIFARVVPEQKMLIVKALKNNGDIIAMTGDGVNDAPALKSANIGIAMGEKGTDVAREAADLVLLKDDFSSIVSGVRVGRMIFDNLKKALRYIAAIHIPIAGLAFLPLIFDLPIIFFPAHIAFLEMIIDPSCSLIFEAEKEEKNIMRRPPRNLKKPLFGRKSLLVSFIQGLVVLLVIWVVFVLMIRLGHSENEARTVTFVLLIILNLVLIINNLSLVKNLRQIIANKNKTLGWISLAVMVATILVIFVPFLRQAFRFTFLNLTDIIVIIIASLIAILCLECFKLIIKKFLKAKIT